MPNICQLTRMSLLWWYTPRVIDPCQTAAEVKTKLRACGCGYTLRPRQNGRRFADDTFKRIFLNENVRISIKISLKFVLKGPINNNPAVVQIMAWRRSGDKPLSELLMVSLLTHLCVTRPQWVNIPYGGRSIELIHKSCNAPVPYPTMRQCFSEWCFVGSRTGALWDLWDWYIPVN